MAEGCVMDWQEFIESRKPVFVAEVSSNHNQDLDRCLAFIEKASEIGCDAVKFQLFRVRELFAPEILERSEEHRRREAWELPVHFLPVLAERCRERGLRFGCTPAYLDAVEELLPHVDFYKISSYELMWNELLVSVAATGKPVVLSTGMATMEEIERAVGVLRKNGCKDLVLLHCVSGYPTPYHECNLAAIESLRRAWECLVGWSDHTVSPGVIHRAIHKWDAVMVEFHLDLDGKGEEYKTGHCWLPGQIQAVIKDAREGCGADGSGEKVPSSCELPDRDWRADPSDGLRPLVGIRKKVF